MVITPAASAFSLIAALVLLAAPRGADAHASYRASIPNGDNVYRNGVHWPGVGHIAAAGGGNAENSFGNAFAAAGHVWTTGLCQADTDGDGFTNGMELGDPECSWTTGALPERTADITHPGFADSAPSTTTTAFRLVGPNAWEGVLQARIHPLPWGAVNFGHLTTEWAHEYCKRAGVDDPTRMARAYPLKDAPPWAWQYMPDAPNHNYISISDRGACGSVDVTACAYSYSQPGSPQNTTGPDESLWVDCRYELQFPESPAGFMPVRLLGPEPGFGLPQVLRKDHPAWDQTPQWDFVKFPFSSPPYAYWCNRLMGFTGSASYVSSKARPTPYDTDMYVSAPYLSKILITDCPAPTPLSQCDWFDVPSAYVGSDYRQYYTFAECQAEERFYFNGPAQLDLAMAVNATLPDQAAFEALLLSTFPELSAPMISIRRFVRNESQHLTHVALTFSNTGAMNGNALLHRIPADHATTFEILGFDLYTAAAKFHWVADTGGAPTTVPNFMIDGPHPWEGVLKARYGSSDPWGVVNWITGNADIARDMCSRVGQVYGDYIAMIDPVSNIDNATDYIGDGYVSISDPMECLTTNAIMENCKWFYSAPGVPRNITNAYAGAYINCKWQRYPYIRLLGATQGQGWRQIRFENTNDWHYVGYSQPTEQSCYLAGYPCTDAACSVVKVQLSSLPVPYKLIECDMTRPLGECQIQAFDPPLPTNIRQAVCWAASRTSGPASPRRRTPMGTRRRT